MYIFSFSVKCFFMSFAQLDYLHIYYCVLKVYVFQSLLDMLFAGIFSHPVVCLIILLIGSVSEFFLSSVSFLKNTLLSGEWI